MVKWILSPTSILVHMYNSLYYAGFNIFDNFDQTEQTGLCCDITIIFLHKFVKLSHHRLD